MVEQELLQCVKTAVLEIEPTAEVILFGSRARGDARPDSDWDFLVLLEGSVDHARRLRVYERLYQLEGSLGYRESLAAVVRSQLVWESDWYHSQLLYQNVKQEGVPL